MATKEKITETAKAEYNDRIEEYRGKISEFEKRVRELEAAIKTTIDDKDRILKRLELSEVGANMISYYCAMSQVSFYMLNYKNETFLNEARKVVYKVLLALEEAYGNYLDDPLNSNDDVHELLGDSITDEWKYHFAQTLGYNIDMLKTYYGENSKWRWSFVEIEGRFAMAVKNSIAYKSFIKNMDPRVPGYTERLNLINMVKRLLKESAEAYRTKYELKEQRIDDMRYALNMLGAVRKIHVFLNETDDASERKKTYDLWKRKLEDDLKKKEKEGKLH